MKKTVYTYILMLAGCLVLLHTFIPHHHHADQASLVEHRHLVEHALGLHNEAEEKSEHHEHHENTIDEIMIVSATAQYHFDWQKVLMPCICPPIYVNVPEPYSVEIGSALFSQPLAEESQGHRQYLSLRAPPMFSC